jgi:hypothetical protein
MLVHPEAEWPLPEWEYPDPTCMECGEECFVWEEVDIGYGGPFEMWCYCKKCDIETFHPRIYI